MEKSGAVAKPIKPIKRYTPEFKEQSVALAIKDEVSMAEVARDLEVHESSFYAWVTSAKKRSEGEPNLRPTSRNRMTASGEPKAPDGT